MILHTDKQKLKHVSSITHEGKVVLVATDADGTLWYTVKQDGFEDSYLQADPAHRTGWEKWSELPLPGGEKDSLGQLKPEKADQSVIDKEKEEFAVPKGSDDLDDLIIRSRYNTYDQSAVAPAQLVSGLGHLYVFRQSKSGTLLVDRFVLDGMTNKLVRKLEVRFKRSGQKYKPLQSTKDGKPGKLATIDSLNFRDANNLPFYEPTTELSLVKNLANGWFSVVLVPTSDHDIHRWHLFVYESKKQQVEIISIRSSKEGLFDLKDHFVVHPQPATVSGIIRRTITIKPEADQKDKGTDEIQELQVTNGIAATKFDIQTERETEAGPQLLREATRIMLAIPTANSTAALNFAVATDGTLSRIDESPEGLDKPLRAIEREIMLPLNTLDEIRAIGDSAPPPHGHITALRRNGEDDRVAVTSTSKPEKMKVGDFIKIEGTVSYDGHYDEVREPVKDDAFSVNVKTEAPESMGAWTKIEKEETGLVFDGIITGLQRKDGVMAVTSPGHGLSPGDEVQIEATRGNNGVYQIAEINGSDFTLERKWQPGESINVKREAGKRRGIQFNDAQAYIETPVLELDDPAAGKPCGATYSAWVFVPEGGATDRLLVAEKDQSIQLSLTGGHVVLKVYLTNGIETLRDPDPIPQGEWVHYAAVVSTTQRGAETLKTTLVLCRNGLEVSSSEHREAAVMSAAFTEKKLQPDGLEAALEAAGGLEADMNSSVAISGDTAIIGIYPAGKFYRQGMPTGAAYVFERQGAEWTQAQILQPGNLQPKDQFGSSVAISGDIVMVGAPGDYSEDPGAVYVFKRQGVAWKAERKLQPDDLQAGDQFGYSVSISGDTAIVGAESANDGDGAAYVFERQATGWTQVKRFQLERDPKIPGARFGSSVAINGDTAIIGAWRDRQAGAAYVFSRRGGAWALGQKLQSKDLRRFDGFGCSVAISGDIAIVRAVKRRAAYVFERHGGEWTQSPGRLKTDDFESGYYSETVAINGDSAIVAAGSAAHVFKRLSEEWTQVEKLQPSDLHDSVSSVAISESMQIVGVTNGPAYIFSGGKRIPAFWIGGVPAADAQSAGPIKLADVQIWNKARTPQEIKDSMYLTLTGQELALAGYWRMGGILPGEPRTVVDFSVHRQNATVYGDAFVAARTLNRHLHAKDKDGNAIPATEFKNEELFAVSQRASYIETFEFRVDDGKTPPDDLFTFSYWGKKSRGAEGQIPDPEKPEEADAFAVTPSPFKPAAEAGWYVAACSFRVPDDVTLVRSFGISKVTGDWSELHVRKQRIINVSDSITEERLADEVPLKTLADDQEALQALKKLDDLEKKEGKVLREKRHIEMLLSSDARWAALIGAKKEAIQKEESNLRYYGSWYDYWKKENDRAALAATLFDNDYYGGGQKSYKIGYHRGSTWGFGVTSVKVPKGLRVTLFSDEWGNRGERSVVLTEDNVNVGRSDDFNDATASIEVATIQGNTNAEHIQSWVKYYRDARDQSQDHLTKLKKQLADLERERTTDPDQLEQRLKEVNKELNTLTELFAPLYTKVLEGVANARQAAHAMASLARDGRGLETKGALLGFVRPVSRLSALESSEGNVQLSYIDAAGWLRHTNYDATADSANSRFEVWLPDGLRSCINFNQSQGPLSLPEKKRIVLPEDWTIEAWVSFPLAGLDDHGGDQPKYWRALAGSEDGQDGYIVAEYDPMTDTELLGIRVANQFHSSGYDLTHLADGWHHLAAVAQGGKIVFYLDGADVSAHELVEARENVKKLEDASPDALNLANARQDLEDAKTRLSSSDKKDKSAREKLIQDDTEKLNDLEKVASKEVKEAADKIIKARKSADELELKAQARQPITTIGRVKGSKPFGKVAEVRIWNVALTEEEIEVNSKTLLSGNEPGLHAYYPMDEAAGSEVRDQTGNEHDGTVAGLKWWGCAAPIGLIEYATTKVAQFDAMVSAEYSTISQDTKTGRKVSMMRRCLAYPSPEGIAVLADKRIEELELVWVGNAQFAPTLLGYIEGAPPIPSENLTVKSNYNGATSVKLTASEDVAYSWDRSSNAGAGAKVETFIGVESETSAWVGVGAGTLQVVSDSKQGMKGSLDTGFKSLTSSHISAKSAIRMSDSLALHGTQEQRAKFPGLGKRFIPKNVGYALVVSALADVFISRLRRSKRMIGYQTIPVEDIPPDINTITFLINPAYTMAGSLDGMTGSRATSDRFFKHVPEMRAQYGSQYPASFFRLKEAYDLKEQIDREDKRRESYFENFNARLTDDASLSREASSGDAPGVIGVNRLVDKKGGKELTNEEKEAAANKQAQKAEETATANASKTSEIVKEKRAQIDANIADQNKRTQAQGGLVALQRRMDDIQARAGKRNIVNNYVWDADGGMRAEAQSFADSAAYTVGGSSHINAQLGYKGDFAAILSVELTAQATMTLTQTMAKTQSHTNGFGLDVSVSGVESTGITDHDDYPIMPGEKVDRYRFMSFYLEGSTRNFNDFFDYVVDPEWLASNDEEARALRQAKGKANQTWRVLHRVTYVERPALMGFGRDMRPLPGNTEKPTVEQQLQALSKEVDELKDLLKSKL